MNDSMTITECADGSYAVSVDCSGVIVARFYDVWGPSGIRLMSARQSAYLFAAAPLFIAACNEYRAADLGDRGRTATAKTIADLAVATVQYGV
jgi:hypothetical protein